VVRVLDVPAARESPMIRFTQGPPDEMQVWIACGIAAYLALFPLVVTAAVVCAEVFRGAGRDRQDAAGAPGKPTEAGLAHQRGGVTSVLSPSEPGVGTAA
jgi:hypothetical protein